jgi:hypothetical protein
VLGVPLAAFADLDHFGGFNDMIVDGPMERGP